MRLQAGRDTIGETAPSAAALETRQSPPRVYVARRVWTHNASEERGGNKMEYFRCSL